MKKNKIICIIPARGGSKGIPKKNLIDFCGKPLLQWTIDQAKGSKLINDIIVSSDDSEILKLALNCGVLDYKRPKEISGDGSTSEEALNFTLFGYKKRHNSPDLIVFLQATSPLRTYLDIDNAINELIKNNYDSLFSACPIRDFLVWEKTQQEGLRPLNHQSYNRLRRQDITETYVENGSIYVFKPEILLKHNNRLGGKIGMYVMDKWKIHEIDDIEDLHLCEFLMKKHLLITKNTFKN